VRLLPRLLSRHYRLQAESLLQHDKPLYTDPDVQVAINWTICKGALPIPGAKNALISPCLMHRWSKRYSYYLV
jgi:hypothetical protein